MAITITSTVDRETRNPGSETSVLLENRGATPSSAACWVPEIPHRVFSRIRTAERSLGGNHNWCRPQLCDRGIRRRDEAALIVPQPGRTPAAARRPAWGRRAAPGLTGWAWRGPPGPPAWVWRAAPGRPPWGRRAAPRPPSPRRVVLRRAPPCAAGSARAGGAW